MNCRLCTQERGVSGDLELCKGTQHERRLSFLPPARLLVSGSYLFRSTFCRSSPRHGLETRRQEHPLRNQPRQTESRTNIKTW